MVFNMKKKKQGVMTVPWKVSQHLATPLACHPHHASPTTLPALCFPAEILHVTEPRWLSLLQDPMESHKISMESFKVSGGLMTFT